MKKDKQPTVRDYDIQARNKEAKEIYTQILKKHEKEKGNTEEV